MIFSKETSWLPGTQRRPPRARPGLSASRPPGQPWAEADHLCVPALHPVTPRELRVCESYEQLFQGVKGRVLETRHRINPISHTNDFRVDVCVNLKRQRGDDDLGGTLTPPSFTFLLGTQGTFVIHSRIKSGTSHWPCFFSALFHHVQPSSEVSAPTSKEAFRPIAFSPWPLSPEKSSSSPRLLGIFFLFLPLPIY